MSTAITFEELKELTSYDKTADVVTCLERNNISYIQGKRGRPFTTEQALNAAMNLNGGKLKRNDDAEEIRV